jgi:hypothetical protein
VDLRDLRGDPRVSSGPLSARWAGFWRLPDSGRFELVARGEGAVSVSIDGREIVAGQLETRPRAQIDLDAGFRTVVVTYQTTGGPGQLRLAWSRAGEPRRDLDPRSLFAAVPSSHEQAWGRAAAILRAVALAASLACGLALLVRFRRARALRAALGVALPAAVVAYGAGLRFEALVGRYAWEGPRWALEVGRALEALHPPAPRWEPAGDYSGDPYNYLRRARTMEGFYEPDVREPVFPFVTRQLLRLLDDRPLAVNAASALFSTLTVLATYRLGAVAFSPVVGLVAALALALDRDVLWWSVEGFRDDAFTFFVVWSALALLRLRRRPTSLGVVAAGLAGAGACLTRITSLSFLLPAYVYVFLVRGEGAEARRRGLALSLLVLVVVAGPYFLGCALAYGDPFYAVNHHTEFYRARSGMPHDEPMSWIEYLRTSFPPRRLVEFGLRGLTVYPFANKWRGLDYLSPWLARGLAGASLVGLALFLRSSTGRLLLVVLVTALLPYAFTWPIPGGAEWRFTMHAYPFYLIAASLGLTQAVALVGRGIGRLAGTKGREVADGKGSGSTRY